MADSSLQAVYRALKAGDLAPVYYVTGDEDMLKDDLIAAIADAALDPAARDFNFDNRSAGDLDGEALHTLIETPPMLADRRVVVVRGLEQWRRNAKVWAVLEAYLPNPSPTTVLILTHRTGKAPSGGREKEEKPHAPVSAHARTVTAAGLAPDQVHRWVVKRAQRAGLTLDDDAAAHLVQAVRGDLASLAMEIEKLAAAAPTGGAVTTDDVAALVGVRRGETLHDWVDAALAREVPRAVELVDVVLAHPGVSAVQMVFTLGTALIGARTARALLDGTRGSRGVEGRVFEVLRQARPAPHLLRSRNWKAEAARWTTAAAHWTASELDGALTAAHDADKALKSTTVSDERGILTTMLLGFAPPDRAAA